MLGAAVSMSTIDREKEKDNVQYVVVAARVALCCRNSYALQTFGIGVMRSSTMSVRSLPLAALRLDSATTDRNNNNGYLNIFSCAEPTLEYGKARA